MRACLCAGLLAVGCSETETAPAFEDVLAGDALDDSKPDAPEPDDVPDVQADDILAAPDDADAPTDVAEVLDNAPDVPEVLLPLDKELNVSPKKLDFGTVGTGKTEVLTVTFANAGSVPITVVDLALESETGEFAFLNEPPDKITIEPNDFYVLKVVFQNQWASDDEEVFGTLHFVSTDREAPMEIPLVANRGMGLGCLLEFVPQSLNFGWVPYDVTKSQAINIENVGDAPCSWSHAVISDGSEIFPGIGGCNLLPSDVAVSPSVNFEVVSTPPAIQNGIQPGQTAQIVVEYAPDPSIFSSASDEFFEFRALLQVTVLEFSGGEMKKLVFPEPNQPSSSPTQASCNLVGKSGTANLAAFPTDINAGPTEVGCLSATTKATFYNLGKAPLAVCELALQGCSGHFTLVNTPAIPPCPSGGLILNGSASFEVEVAYSPQELGQHQCTLAVETIQPEETVLVTLSGTGTETSQHTDQFLKLAPEKADILFVLDNSGSMATHLEVLQTNLQALPGWPFGDLDLHIGVVTGDLSDTDPDAAKLVGMTDVRFLSSGNADLANLQGHLNIAADGAGTQQGLAAAFKALSLPADHATRPRCRVFSPMSRRLRVCSERAHTRNQPMRRRQHGVSARRGDAGHHLHQRRGGLLVQRAGLLPERPEEHQRLFGTGPLSGPRHRRRARRLLGEWRRRPRQALSLRGRAHGRHLAEHLRQRLDDRAGLDAESTVRRYGVADERAPRRWDDRRRAQRGHLRRRMDLSGRHQRSDVRSRRSLRAPTRRHRQDQLRDRLLRSVGRAHC